MDEKYGNQLIFLFFLSPSLEPVATKQKLTVLSILPIPSNKIDLSFANK